MDRFTNWKKPIIEHATLTKWNWLVYHPDKLTMGERVDIGAFTYINALHGVELGDDVQLGSHCSIYSISTIDDKHGKVVIKKKTCIGSHSVVMPGVTIGENTIVGAFSFVTKDLPDNVIAMGVPAKVVRERSEQ